MSSLRLTQSILRWGSLESTRRAPRKSYRTDIGSNPDMIPEMNFGHDPIVVLSREPHLDRGPTYGAIVTRGRQSINTSRAGVPLARLHARTTPRWNVSAAKFLRGAPRLSQHQIHELSTRVSHTTPMLLKQS
jgi:hypothetical protein